MDIYLSERNEFQEAFFRTYITYCPLFYNDHESDSNAVNPFGPALCRWDNKYPLL